MNETVECRCVGGPADGRTLHLNTGATGLPVNVPVAGDGHFEQHHIGEYRIDVDADGHLFLQWFAADA